MSKDKPSAVLQLNAANKAYRDKSILSDFDLTIYDGEFVTLLGPSGCGKTTVLRIIAGLEPLDGGAIYLGNEDITRVPAEKRHINTVFQSYALFPHMTVYENIAFGLRTQKVAEAEIRQRVNEALAAVQLNDFHARMPSELSGGQQQRVAIARAVVNKPRLLLLDESLSALDYKLRKQMQNELKRLQRQLGITFVFVTHDQEEALSMSDRIVVMNNGTIEQQGSPREIYENPANLFVAQFIGESNIFDALVLQATAQDEYQVEIEQRQFTIHSELPLQPQQRVHVLLRPEDMRLVEIANGAEQQGLIGKVLERNYKGMTLDSVIELESGKQMQISEFFDEDDPDFDHSLGQQVAITWVASWEVVLPYEG
ncbi:spermidine/putrescine ABC transporter ATP-binding protein PotA [Ferrimonas lipolytica]|uniref:Spermidine/putrescine import ATP-binding protein PotA n=1 Tax=Ferrimonas lipolytica TaxID=2724191 RepID=A0A6H1UE27_9GAMM|nr:spermidine/putrescine ABC transporter ATP-binding protein PotA [Ferrimonas lipolytica]QIZ76593.1 spermidine/putrescine ABC transporter ATP-binding protein PotA [Ferrimonas lipolytica]